MAPELEAPAPASRAGPFRVTVPSSTSQAVYTSMLLWLGMALHTYGVRAPLLTHAAVSVVVPAFSVGVSFWRQHLPRRR